MKRALQLTILFISCFSLNQISAQCDPPSILWDEDGMLLNWIAKDNATSHVLRYRPTGTFQWTEVTIEDETFFDVRFLETCVEYDFRVRTICDDLQSSFTPVYTFAINCGTCYAEYCEIPELFDYSVFITNVTIKDFVSQTMSTGIGYEDLRGVPELVLAPGEEADISLQISDFAFYNQLIEVYIDFNRNQEFEEEDLAFSGNIGTFETLEGVINVPLDIDFGVTRMRVIVRAFAYNGGACDGDVFSFSGEVEEYCLILGELPSACDFEFDAEITGVNDSDATFEWQDLLAAAAYNVRYKKTSEGDDEWNELATIDTFIVIGDLDQCEEYEFQVRGVCPFDTSAYKNTIVFNSFCPTHTEESLLISEIKSYPNPWASSLALDITSIRNQYIDISIIDSKGTETHVSSNLFVTKGKSSLNLDQLNSLPAGVYYIRVKDEANKISLIKTIKIQ